MPAAFYETTWFRALCRLDSVTIVFGLHRWRLRRVAEQAHGRLAAKTGERERIARDLHHTLLQSTQSLILRLELATSTMPPGDPTRQDFEHALVQANDVMAEDRDRVLDLRLAADLQRELPQAVAAVGRELAQSSGVAFESVVEGASRTLQPRVHEQAYGIGREALFNAFRHAQAR